MRVWAVQAGGALAAPELASELAEVRATPPLHTANADAGRTEVESVCALHNPQPTRRSNAALRHASSVACADAYVRVWTRCPVG